MSDYIRECRILSKNFITDDCTFTLSHGGDSDKLFDRDKLSLYQTTGANRDDIDASITIIFKEGTTETNVTFNNFILLNTNVKDIEFYKYVSGQYVKAFDYTIPLGHTYISIAFGDITTSRCKLVLKNTQERYNQEKYVGEMILTKLRYVLSQNPVEYNIKHREKKVILDLSDGSKHVAYTKFSDNRVSKYGCTVSFSLMPQNDLDFLQRLKDEGTPFLWWPEHDVKPQEIYYVNWINPLTANYSDQFKGAGYDLSMELEEV